MEKLRTLKVTKQKILKIGGHITIPHICKLLNLVVKKGFPKLLTQKLNVHIFKSGCKNNTSNYLTIMISPTVAKLYSVILEKKISNWLESEGNRAKRVLEGNTLLWTISLRLG